MILSFLIIVAVYDAFSLLFLLAHESFTERVKSLKLKLIKVESKLVFLAYLKQNLR